MKVCILGDVMLDVYRHVAPRKLSQEAPVIVAQHAYDQYIPGGAANAAANCAALGAEAHLIGYIGYDNSAQWLVKALQAMNVTNDCVTLASWTTITKERIVDAATGHQFVRIDYEAADPVMQKCDSSVLVDRLKVAVQSCDCLFVSDYAKGTCRWIVGEAIALFKAAGKFVIVNGKPINTMHYKLADVVTMNKHEWAQVTSKVSDVKALQGYMKNLLPGTTLIITCGPKPTIVLRPDAEPEMYACRKVDVADVSGAGDTLAAVLAVRAGLSQRTIEEAVKIATEVVQYKGTAVPQTRLLD